MVTADEIRSRTFLVALRGYDRDEVKTFLVEVADTIAALQGRVQELEGASDRQALDGEAAEAEEPVEPATEQLAVPQAGAPEVSPFAEIGKQTQRILEAAQQAAEDIRTKARADAERELKQARSQATRLIADGERRRESIEQVVEALTGARAELSEDLREVGRTIERVLRELGPEPAAATVREALAAAAREETDAVEVAPAAGNDAREGTPGPEDPSPDRDEEGAGERADASEEAGPGEPIDSGAKEPEAGEGEVGAEDETGTGKGDDVEAAQPLGGEPLAGEAHAPGNGAPQPDAGARAEVSVGSRPGPASGAGEVYNRTAGSVATGAAEQGPATGTAQATSAEQDRMASTAAAPETQPTASEPAEVTPEPASDGGYGLPRRAQALAPLHPRLVRKLKRGLQDVQNATLDLLRRNPERSDVEPFLPDDSAVQALAALAEEQLSLANATGIAAGAQATGTPVSLQPSGEALAAQLGSELGGVLVTRLADTLRAGFDAGQSLSALTERVDTVFTRMKSGVAGDVAAVALVRAYEGGQKDAWAAAGVTHRRWVRAMEPACTDPRCVDNEAAGPVPVGERFPSRHDAPPVRPGCHCSTAPVRR